MWKSLRLLGMLTATGICAVQGFGCGRSADGPTRRVVAGTVNFDKEPVDYGMIRFIPQPTGPVAVAMIQQGKFKCDSKGGVPVGTVRVEIESMPNTSGMSEDDLLKKGAPAAVAIPQKYNQTSELSETIPSGSDEFSLNFDLKK